MDRSPLFVELQRGEFMSKEKKFDGETVIRGYDALCCPKRMQVSHYTQISASI